MIQAFAMTNVMCRSCGVTVTMHSPVIFPNEALIETAAASILADGHRKEKTICTRPKMVVLYVNAMVPDDMLVSALKI